MRRLLIVVAIVVAGVLSLVVGVYIRVPAGQVAPGVRLNGIDLSGKTPESAREAIDEYARVMLKRRFRLKSSTTEVKGKTYGWDFTSEQLGLSVDVEATLARTMQAGRENAVGKISQMFGAGSIYVITAAPALNADKQAAALKTIAHSVNRAPVNARFHITDSGAFNIVPGKSGISLDIPATGAAVTRQWNEMLGSVEPKPALPAAGQSEPDRARQQTPEASQAGIENSQDAAQVDLVFTETEPKVGNEDASKIDGPVGEMNTRIRGTAQRVNNVTIATSHINGTLLAPGEIFSYNKVVGKRSEEGGYEKAIIFVKGRHVEDVGGGICQTASTLYNAVLRSGLKVVRRQPHCTPVVYVPYGLDATVAYGVVDFQFQNDTDFPVYIYAMAKGRSLTFRLYGKTDSNRKVVLEKLRQSSTPCGVQVVQDKSLKPGRRIVKDKGARGYSIAWRRTVIENGRTVKTETISSHYRPISSIVLVGPGTASKPALPAAPILPGAAPAPAAQIRPGAL